MFVKTLLALSAATFIGLSTAVAATFDTVVCTAEVDAEAIVSSALAEPSLELGSGEKTVALINDKLATNACTAAENLDISLDNIEMRLGADGIRLGTTRTNVGYAIVVDGILDNL